MKTTYSILSDPIMREGKTAAESNEVKGFRHVTVDQTTDKRTPVVSKTNNPLEAKGRNIMIINIFHSGIHFDPVVHQKP